MIAAMPALLASAALCTPRPRPVRSVTKTLGVDFGLARVGVAVSSGFAPLPLAVLPCGGSEEADFTAAARGVARYCMGEGAVQVVLGMPYNSSGGEGDQAVITRAFATHLADAVAPRPVFLWDERFSSAEASMRMHGGRGAERGERIDAVAAAVILEDFFNAEDEAVAAAPHVPSRPRPAASATRPAVAPRPPPLSQSEVRRAMMERAAREGEERTQTSGKAGKKKRGRRK